MVAGVSTESIGVTSPCMVRKGSALLPNILSERKEGKKVVCNWSKIFICDWISENQLAYIIVAIARFHRQCRYLLIF